MKTLSGIFVLTLLAASFSSAQVGFGIKGGVDFATIGGADAVSDAKTRTGFVAGAYLDLNVPFVLNVQPEVLYTVKGFQMDVSPLPATPPTETVTNTYSYLEVPILIKYSLPVPVVKPSLYVGPEMAFLLSAKSKHPALLGGTVEDDAKSIMASTDFGLVFGASAHVLVIDIDVRYDLGLKTTVKDGSGKVYNRVWSIMAGIPLY